MNGAMKTKPGVLIVPTQTPWPREGKQKNDARKKKKTAGGGLTNESRYRGAQLEARGGKNGGTPGKIPGTNNYS